jgi:hypothetical protein
VLNVFYGWSRDDLLAALRKAQEEIAKGKTIVSTGSDGISAGFQQSYSPEVRLSMIRRALYELDPVEFCLFGASGQNRTRVVHNSGGTAF